MKEMTDAQVRNLEKVADEHIYYNVTEQIQREREFAHQIGNDVYDEIEEALRFEDEDGEIDEVEVYQWFTVSEDFAYHAKNFKQIIVETPFGNIWGRQSCGCSVVYDDDVRALLEKLAQLV